MSVAKKLQPITETSCLVNIMHEILVDRWKRGISSIAVCPTQRLERHLGADVLMPEFEKLLALQFKAYKRFKYAPLEYFAISRKQHGTLLGYPSNCAYYVFPDYKTHFQMSYDRRLELLGNRYKILNNTWFVEVHNVPLNTKKVWRKQLQTGQIPSTNWSQLSEMLRECVAGFRTTKVKDRCLLQDTEEKVVETLSIPSGKFSLFYTKLSPDESWQRFDET